jgi:hypothetical protein
VDPHGRIPRVTVTLNDIELGELEAALARAACAGLHLLDITVRSCHGETITAYQVAAALAAADRLSPVEFRFGVCPRISCSRSGVYLPSFSRATSIEMNWLRDLTPAASGLPAVERLTLCSENDLRLANLIPRCPSLRVLDLRLDSDSLDSVTSIHSTSVEELHVSRMGGYNKIIDIVAPMLKQLDLTVDTGCADDMIASIWAPAMQKLSWCCHYGNGAASVACIGILWRFWKLKLTAVERGREGTIPWEDDTCLYLPIFSASVRFCSCPFQFSILQPNSILCIFSCELVPQTGGSIFQPDPDASAEWDLAEEIRKIKNTFPDVEFSTLKLDVCLEETGHVFGPLVLSILGINWICQATKKLKIKVHRWSVKVST